MDSNTIGAIINAVPLAFIGWLFLSLSRRIDTLTTRIDKLYELLAGQSEHGAADLPRPHGAGRYARAAVPRRPRRWRNAASASGSGFGVVSNRSPRKMEFAPARKQNA